MTTWLGFTALGCGDDQTGETEATLTSDSGESESESETGPGLEPSLAHEIDIDLVEITQGVAIPIVMQGEWVEAANRNAPILAGRDTLLRAYWVATPAFVVREIEARLTLTTAEGEQTVRSQRLEIDSLSYPGDLSRSFTFELLAADMVPGLSFSISLWDVEADFVGLPAPALEPVSPRDGQPALIGVQSEPAEIKVVMVPVEAAWPGCASMAPADTLAPLFHDMLFMKNPAQQVELELHRTPIVYTEPLESFGDLLLDLQDYRVADDAAPNTYYYGLIDACALDIQGLGGLAFAIPPADASLGWQRVSAGLWFGDDQWAADTFVHEIGHLQGLAHVYCPGEDAALPDPDYPYDDGVIGVWGFGVLDFQVRSPTVARDYMSYCYAGSWSSDWTWAKNFERIRTLTSWDYEGQGAGEPDGEILVGILGADGRARWSTTRGGLGAANHVTLMAQTRAGPTRAVHATVHAMPDGDARVLSVAMPEPLVAVEFEGRRVAIPGG